MFVNRGMIEAAHSEGDGGVMAHESSHVALRHGTAQATKSQGLGVQLGAIGGAIRAPLSAARPPNLFPRVHNSDWEHTFSSSAARQ